MVNIIIATQYKDLINEQAIIDSAQTVLDYVTNNDNSELTIVLDSDKVIQDLNQTYLGIDAPTDVLSFEANELDPDSGKIYLGDVVISLPRAETQAAGAGHPLQSEVLLLVIHGILHLLGYDHDNPDAKLEMWNTQQKMLDRLGVEINHLPEV